jgi:hypothetical protein
LSLFQKFTELFQENKKSPPDLFRLLGTAWLGQSVFVAVKLELLENLDAGPQSLESLARCTSTPPGALHVVLSSLEAIGLLRSDEEKQYHLTENGRPLLRSEQSWLRAYVLVWGEQLFPAAQKLNESLQQDTRAFTLAHGSPAYDYYQKTPESGELFREFMNGVTIWQTQAILASFDFSEFTNVVDVGGGHGNFLLAVLEAYPEAQGVLFDQPQQEQHAARLAQQRGLTDRFRFIGGSFFDKIPVQSELYMIKHVLHDWNDQEVQAILGSICEAMGPKSRLLIVEGLRDKIESTDLVGTMRALEQFIWCGGNVRDSGEFRELLGSAGLECLRIEKTDVVDCCLILAQKRERAD